MVGELVRHEVGEVGERAILAGEQVEKTGEITGKRHRASGIEASHDVAGPHQLAQQ